jgi:Viral BACON domain
VNQCLRCKKPCGDNEDFCEDCRSHLRSRLQQNETQSRTLPSKQVIENVLAGARSSREAGAKTISASLQYDAADLNDEDMSTPGIPALPVGEEEDADLLEGENTEEADALPDEADPLLTQYIASSEEEDADSLEGENTEEEDGLLDETDPRLRRYVAGNEEEDADLLEGENTGEDVMLPDEADPLLTRHLPSIAESILIEEEDIQRAIEQGEYIAPALLSSPKPRLPGKWPRSLRLVFFLLSVVTILALIGGGVVAFLNPPRQTVHAKIAKALPALTVTPGIVHADQIVLLHINNFSPLAKIRLTRDIQETVRTDTGSPFIMLSADGDGDARILVDDTWGPGSHMVEAEDVVTHYTASAVLQVLSDLPLRPPHLLASLPGTTAALLGPLDMGANEQGANTLQSLVLHNTGGGWVSWSAVSNQPWLMTSPQQGIFRVGQRIFVAVTRANLKPGDYDGTITIVSNGGASVVQLKMTVLPLPASDAAVSSIMLVTPPVFSFTSIDGGADPAPQSLTINDPGSQPLNWSLAISSSVDTYNQNFYAEDDVSWVSIDTTAGTVLPGASSKLQLNLHSRNLLPSVYNALLTFTSGLETLNTPQVVAISLTVQSRCGVATNLGNLAFSITAGQSTAGSQLLALNTSSGCTGTVNWQGFSSASWLSITPARGLLQPDASSLITVETNTGALLPGRYTGLILFVVQKRSQTLVVQLTVQPSPPAPISTSPVPGPVVTPAPTAVLGLSPGSLQFTLMQGQINPPGQALTMSNAGASTLFWQANIDAAAAPWLSLNPMGGTIAAARSTQVMVAVNGAGLSPGNYNAQITVTATDSSGNQVQGSPQTALVTLTVLSGCSLQVTPASLSFVARPPHPNPPGQDLVLNVVGTCPQTFTWTASVNVGSQKWLVLSAKAGSAGAAGSTIVVSVKAKTLLPGPYNGQITISAIGKGGGAIQNSPVTIPVTLTVI